MDMKTGVRCALHMITADFLSARPYKKPYSFLRPFLCFTTNQFEQKFKCLDNLITYFVNICNIY